jgi:hypothetical protein
METMSRWTDARLDDLNERVADMGRRMDEGFNRTHADLQGLRAETRAEIAALHRLILQAAGGMFATLAVGFAGLIATQL